MLRNSLFSTSLQMKRLKMEAEQFGTLLYDLSDSISRLSSVESIARNRNTLDVLVSTQMKDACALADKIGGEPAQTGLGALGCLPNELITYIASFLDIPSWILLTSASKRLLEFRRPIREACVRSMFCWSGEYLADDSMLLTFRDSYILSPQGLAQICKLDKFEGPTPASTAMSLLLERIPNHRALPPLLSAIQRLDTYFEFAIPACTQMDGLHDALSSNTLGCQQLLLLLNSFLELGNAINGDRFSGGSVGVSITCLVDRQVMSPAIKLDQFGYCSYLQLAVLLGARKSSAPASALVFDDSFVKLFDREGAMLGYGSRHCEFDMGEVEKIARAHPVESVVGRFARLVIRSRVSANEKMTRYIKQAHEVLQFLGIDSEGLSFASIGDALEDSFRTVQLLCNHINEFAKDIPSDGSLEKRMCDQFAMQFGPLALYDNRSQLDIRSPGVPPPLPSKTYFSFNKNGVNSEYHQRHRATQVHWAKLSKQWVSKEWFWNSKNISNRKRLDSTSLVSWNVDQFASAECGRGRFLN